MREEIVFQKSLKERTDEAVSACNSSGAVDTGNRTELISGGGMRDINPENGRCDLMPLDIVSDIIGIANYIPKDVIIGYFEIAEHQAVGKILNLVNDYIYRGNANALLESVVVFAIQNYATKNITTDNFNDVLSATLSSAILDLSHRYREGAEKYAERNWEKGIPIKSFIDSGVRHLLKWCRLDTDENHASAFMWNMIGAVWTHAHKPECIGEMPFNVKTSRNENEVVGSN